MGNLTIDVVSAMRTSTIHQIEQLLWNNGFFTWSGDEIMAEEISQIILMETDSFAWNLQDVTF